MEKNLAATQFGTYFEDFVVDQTYTSPARTITETDVTIFAGLSGDYNPLHTDALFAEQTRFGKRIAHGLLGLSIASGLAARLGFIDGTAEAFLGLDWKFRDAIYIGDTIRVLVRVAQTKQMKRLGGGIVSFNIEVVNQSGTVAQKGIWRVLVRSREESED